MKDNIFFGKSGDTSATANRVLTAVGGPNGTLTYLSMDAWQPNFNTYYRGTGNVASGNLVVDPGFVGGSLGALSNLPTGFMPSYCDVNTNGFQLGQNSPAKIAGIVLSSPFNVTIQCVTRRQFTPGVYENIGSIPQPPTNLTVVQ